VRIGAPAKISVSKAMPEVRGHTSYLTFALLLPPMPSSPPEDSPPNGLLASPSHVLQADSSATSFRFRNHVENYVCAISTWLCIIWLLVRDRIPERPFLRPLVLELRLRLRAPWTQRSHWGGRGVVGLCPLRWRGLLRLLLGIRVLFVVPPPLLGRRTHSRSRCSFAFRLDRITL
jgi:hypothetical protein